MTKAKRQAALLDVVRKSGFKTQGGLVAALRRRGVDASQVTLSRDLRELGVLKTPAGYREPGPIEPSGDSDALPPVLRQFLVDAQPAQNLVVLRTTPGGAAAVALALDRVGWPEIIGTVAGDDTIFAAAASSKTAAKTAERLRSLL